MRTKLFSIKPDDIKWLAWVKGQCRTQFAKLKGIRRTSPEVDLICTYGNDAAGQFAEVLRIPTYRYLGAVMSNPHPYKTAQVVWAAATKAPPNLVTRAGAYQTANIAYSDGFHRLTVYQARYSSVQYDVNNGYETTSNPAYPSGQETIIGDPGLGLSWTQEQENAVLHAMGYNFTSNDYTFGTTEYNADVVLFGEASAGITHVMMSDGVVLVEEDTIYDTLWGQTPSHTLEFFPGNIYVSGQNNPLARTLFEWNGGGNVWMFGYRDTVCTFNHKLTFTVPDDCIAATTPTPPVYPGVDSAQYAAQFAADWIAGYEANEQRRKNLFMSNHTAVITSLKAGQPPAAWDYLIKAGAVRSANVIRNPLMAATHNDEVLSDTTAGFTQNGVKVTRRTAQFSYTLNGVLRQETVVGTMTQTLTGHYDEDEVRVTYTTYDVYENWYVAAGSSAPGNAPSLTKHQFLHDTGGGMGLVWNGFVQQGFNKDSKYGAPSYPIQYLALTPVVPAYDQDLTAAAIPFVTTYRLDVHPEYSPPVGGEEEDN